MQLRQIMSSVAACGSDSGIWLRLLAALLSGRIAFVSAEQTDRPKAVSTNPIDPPLTPTGAPENKEQGGESETWCTSSDCGDGHSSDRTRSGR